jgi:hypothetical protein
MAAGHVMLRRSLDRQGGRHRATRRAALAGLTSGSKPDADAVSVSAGNNAPSNKLELRGKRSYNIMALSVGLEFAAMAGKQATVFSESFEVATGVGWCD